VSGRLRRLVFAHDNVFYRAPDGRFYSSRGRWPWDRYLTFADSLTVLARIEELPPGASLSRYERASREAVDFVAMPNLSSIRGRIMEGRRARQTVEEVLNNSEALIVRLPSETGALAGKVARRMGKPWAVELVTCTWDALWNYGTLQGRLYAPYDWCRIKVIVRRAPFVSYVTRDFLQRRYPSRGESVGCSDVDLAEPDEAVLQQRLRFIEAERPRIVIGLIGYVTPRFKGIPTALEALSLVRNRIPHFQLRILGAGEPIRWQLLAENLGLENSVSFCGTLPAGDPVFRWLDDIDLYIQPSFQEGLPRSLLEAMSRACPALGSTAGGIPELLDSECLHPPGDKATLARLLLRAMTDGEWRKQQAIRNFRHATKYTNPALEPVRAEFWDGFATRAKSPPLR